MQAKKKVDHKAALKRFLESGLEDNLFRRDIGMKENTVIVSIWLDYEIGLEPKLDSYVYHRNNDCYRDYFEKNSRMAQSGSLPVKYTTSIANFPVKVSETLYERIGRTDRGSVKMSDTIPENIEILYKEWKENQGKQAVPHMDDEG